MRQMSKAPAPFARFDERHYDLLADGSDMNGRNLWRVLNARPVLATGRVRDVLDRIWQIPSTRQEGVFYTVDLNKKTCNCKGFQFRSCPHVANALEAETEFLRANADNRLIFPQGHRRAA